MISTGLKSLYSFFGFALILLGSAACQKYYETDHDLSLVLTQMKGDGDVLLQHPEITSSYISKFPRRPSITDFPASVSDRPEVQDEMMPQPMTTLFTMPMAMAAICFGMECVEGIELMGDGILTVDLDQRTALLHSLDLTDKAMMFYLSGEIALTFDDFSLREHAEARAALSLATPATIIAFDPAASMLIHDPDLDAGQAEVEFQASAGSVFLDGHGRAAGNQLQ